MTNPFKKKKPAITVLRVTRKGGKTKRVEFERFDTKKHIYRLHLDRNDYIEVTVENI